MEKKNFKTVEQVADYLNDECYYIYLDKNYEDELKDIEVDGMKKFLPGKYLKISAVCIFQIFKDVLMMMLWQYLQQKIQLNISGK